jgi:hypothetical protein
LSSENSKRTAEQSRGDILVRIVLGVGRFEIGSMWLGLAKPDESLAVIPCGCHPSYEGRGCRDDAHTEPATRV